MQLLTAAALSLFLAANGFAQTIGDPRFNPANGQSTQVWRKAMPIDYSHIRAELDIPDINVAALTGVATLTGEVTGLPVTRIVLDAAGPQPPVPTAATVNGMPVEWTAKDGKVTLRLREELPPRSPLAIVLKYNLSFDQAKGEGLTFAPPDAESERESHRTPVIHAQGQAELNSHWLPMFDSPADRVSSEVIVTVEDGYTVLSNGRLVGSSPASLGSNMQPRTRWHWSLESEHAPYLITLAIGTSGIVDAALHAARDGRAGGGDVCEDP
jgi:aminopeptidase N